MSGPICSTALMHDGRLVAAAPEERFSRIKQDRSFPQRALNFCLDKAGIGLDRVDCFSIAWNPGENIALKYRPGFSDWMRYPGEWLTSVPNHLLPGLLAPQLTEQKFIDGTGRQVVIEYVDHHLAHARLAFHASGFEESAVVVVDGWSEQKTTSIFHGKGNELSLLESEIFPNSIGCVYAAVTQFLGFRPFSDEWKVMGMAAYGNPTRIPQIVELIHQEDDDRYEVNLKFFDFYNFDRPEMYGRRLIELLGKPRAPEEPLLPCHYDIAAAMQQLLETVLTRLLTRAHRLTNSTHLCFTGGVAMNCLFNGSITSRTPFRHAYMGFAPDDSGNSIGAALDASIRRNMKIESGSIDSAVGKGFEQAEIGDAVEKYRLKHRMSNNIGSDVADLLAAGQVVGWFQGRSEFGQRALGHRSILANPLDAGIKNRLNASVKYREEFRPFAPMLPYDSVGNYFKTQDIDPVLFMEKAFHFRPEVVKAIPGVVHADGTGRLQTIVEKRDPLLHELLMKFQENTGIPVLINTSFNTNGEPMVNSPEDALRTFMTSGLDALAIGDILLTKE